METDYWHSLDRESPYRTINPKSIGVSTSITKKGLDQLKTRIFEGASAVELGFLGKGKGNLGQGGITPEMHSKEEREEMRQLSKINEVDLSTHATVAVGGISGLGEGGFKPELKEEAVNEIKRTVDFAAEVAQGGPVVVHTGEFPRPLTEAGEEFEAYPGEKEKAVEHLVDNRTGQLITSIKRDMEIPMPVWKKNKEGQFVDEENRVVPEAERIPEINKETGKIEIKNMEWKHFQEEAKKHNEFHPKEKLTAAQFAYREKLDARRKQLESEEEVYLERVNEIDKNLKQVESDKDFLRDYEEGRITAGTVPGKRRILQEVEEIKKRYRGEDPEKIVTGLKRQKEFYREGAIGFAQGTKEIEEQKKKAEPLEKFGIKESADALARSAIYAYDKEKTMKLKKPLFVAPENIFPEQFGAHPQELKKLILNSREVMAEKLKKERGMTQSEAKKIADEHIKATFDVGHANTWKKFFKKERADEPDDVTEKRFKKWMTDQVSDLQKKGIIGHIHLSDNFGYYDEHLAPGEGNVPLKELTEKLQKHGYKGKFITEWGAQPEKESFRVMTGAWKTLSSPVYKIDTAGVSWSDIEGSYFGRTGSPTYLVGDYAPSKDWTLWSETQLE